MDELAHIMVGHLYNPYLRMSRAARLCTDDYRELLLEAALEALAEHLHDPGAFKPAEGSLQVWLCMKARNFLKAELQARLDWIKSVDCSHQELLPPELEGVVDFERAEDRLWLESAMAAMEADEAEALRLHHGLELPVVEVAEAMQRTVPETQWLLRRGRRTLKDRLEGREPRKPGRPRKETGGTS